MASPDRDQNNGNGKSVPARRIGEGEAQRQRWLTAIIVVGISVTALGVGGAFWKSLHRYTAIVHAPPSPAVGVNQQLSGYTFTRSEQGHPVFTVHAARTVSYSASKSTTLEDVMVEIYGHKGDTGDILRTARCEYNPLSGDFLADGAVEIEISAHSSDLPGSGLRGKHRVVVETSKVAYNQADELAETHELVKFRMGSASGTAVGMTYAVQEDWLELKHTVAMDLAPGTEKVPQPPIHLTASALRYDKRRGNLTLTGPVEIRQGDRRATSENASLQLNNHNRLSRVILAGNTKAYEVSPLRNLLMEADRVQGDFDSATGELRHVTADRNVKGQSKGKGSTSHLTAQRFEIDLGGKHPEPLHGLAKGNVQIDLESQPVLNASDKNAPGKAAEKKSLSASELRLEFWPDNHGLKSADTAGPGTLTISSASPKAGGKVINAGQFLMAFDRHSRIETLHGAAPTKVLFLPPATAPAGTASQQSTANALDANFDSKTQLLREVRQTGNFAYRDGDRQASGDDAHYDALAQTMVLVGHPQVWDPSSRVKSQKMTIDMRTNTATGEGKVQGTHMQLPEPGGPTPRTPPLPTNVLADKMVARRQSQTIHYEGHVRAWNGTDVVESSALDIFRTEKRVSSGSHVVTSFLQPPLSTTGQGTASRSTGKPRPLTIRSDFLEYLDAGKRARYHGNVRLVTEGTTLEADRLDVFLTEGERIGGSEIEHAEAEGHVRIMQPGRVGSGDRADYLAALGKVTLTGGPPSVVDEKKGSTTGQSLTLFIHDDRLIVDGGDQSPSLTQHRVAP